MESPPDISKDLHRTLFRGVFVVMFFLPSIIQMSNACKYGLRLYLIIDIVFKDKQIFSLLKLLKCFYEEPKKSIRFYPFILIFIQKFFFMNIRLDNNRADNDCSIKYKPIIVLIILRLDY